MYMERTRLILAGFTVGVLCLAGQAICQEQASSDVKLLGGVLDPVTDVVEDTVDDVTDVVEDTTEEITSLVGGTIEDIIDDIVDGVVDPLDDLLRAAALTELLEQLGLDHLVDQALNLVGPDEFEPDDTPAQAAWAGLVLLDDLLGQIAIRNFHVQGDIDWIAFYGAAGHEVTVQTFGLFLTANTYVQVYRELGEDEPLPSPWPDECPHGTVPGPNGTTLVPIGCNDNADDTILGAVRSRVQFVAPYDGIYYAAIQYSPMALVTKALFTPAKSKDTGEGAGPETAYVVQTTYEPTPQNSILLNNLFSTLIDSETGERIKDGRVFIKPSNIEIRRNQDGVYPCTGLPDNRYTITVHAANGANTSRVRQMHGGNNYSEHFTLAATTSGGGDNEGETPDPRPGWSGHSADFQEPYGRLSLSEVLRVIQLFNSSEIHCSPASADGFGIGPGPRDCTPHSADYRPQDWKIGLQELLRIIQFFNARGLVPCIGSEDGFCLP